MENRDGLNKGAKVIFYDGVCGLCNRFNNFVLLHDKKDVFKFASLQSEIAKETLKERGKDANVLDTVYFLKDYGTETERLYRKSDAVIGIAKELGGLYGFLATIGGALPRPLRDWCYDRVAQNRYRIFGKLEQCPMPPAGAMKKFVDVEAEEAGKTANN